MSQHTDRGVPCRIKPHSTELRRSAGVTEKNGADVRGFGEVKETCGGILRPE